MKKVLLKTIELLEATINYALTTYKHGLNEKTCKACQNEISLNDCKELLNTIKQNVEHLNDI